MALNEELQIDRTVPKTDRKLRPGQEESEEYESHGFIGLLSFITVAIVGPLLIFGILLVVYAQLGLGLNDNETPIQKVQIALWFTVWGTIILLLVLKFLRDKKSNFLKYCRKLFLYIGPIILIFTSISFVVQYSNFNIKANAAPACDLNSQLAKARTATYYIGGDEGSGSAFAINANGGLLTANHVIEGNANLYTYISDSKGASQKIPVEVVKTDSSHDLALLTTNTSTSTYLGLSVPDDNLVGQDVYAVGFPSNAYEGGFATVTKGVVSRTLSSTYLPGAPADMSFVQTDAALNPGNSGGVLIDCYGAIGVNDQISESQQYEGLPRDEGIGYAINSQVAKSVFGL